jgi:hypothetical protein
MVRRTTPCLTTWPALPCAREYVVQDPGKRTESMQDRIDKLLYDLLEELWSCKAGVCMTRLCVMKGSNAAYRCG